MNKNTKLLFAHKLFYDIYFFGVIIIPFFVAKDYGVTAALTFSAIYTLTTMAMELPTGLIGDRFGHKASVSQGALLIGVGLLGLLMTNSIIWDGCWVLVMAIGSALASGSDTALLRTVSNNFERDNRTFDYLKSVMLLLSFGAAGFVVKYLSMDIAVGLSGIMALASAIPLLFMLDIGNEDRTEASFFKQITGLPSALRQVNCGLSLIILAGLVGSIMFSAAEVISSLNPIYQVDISWIGIIAALTMSGRILGTIIEKRLRIDYRPLLLVLVTIVISTVIIESSTITGIVFLVASSIVAKMLSYRLVYRLSSQAPQSHIASLLSGHALLGRLFSASIVILAGLFAGYGHFNYSFLAVGLILAVFGGYLATNIQKQT